MANASDDLIIQLAERLYICSQLLLCAAERLEWDHPRLQRLLDELESIKVVSE